MFAKLIVINLIAVLSYMTLWFGVSRWRKQLNVVDVAWGGGFALVAWLVAAQQPSGRSWLIAVLVSLWALRLVSHLARRVLKGGEDPRYKELSAKWRGHFWLRAFVSVFVLQGLLVVLISLPVTMAAGRQLDGLTWLSIVGTVIWAIGFMVEGMADRQLRTFIGQPANRGKVMDRGLWHYSRHPNYFGELTQWWGIGLIALQASYGWIGLAGPLTLTLLLLFVSGVPMIENRRKADPAYRAYMRRTSRLVPLPPRRG